MPTDATKDLTAELEKLPKENEQLKSSGANATSSLARPAPSGSLRAFFQAQPKKTGSPNNKDKEEVQSVEALDPLGQYHRRKRPAFLLTTAPDQATATKVNAWINKQVPKSDQAKVKDVSQAVLAEWESLSDGDRPNLETILADWGLSSILLSKMPLDVQVKLLAGLQLIRNWHCDSPLSQQFVWPIPSFTAVRS